MAQTGARGSGYVSPRNPTGRAFQTGIQVKQRADEAKARERQALAELSANGGGADLAAISEAHGGADVYTDPDTGVVVVDYS